MSITDRMRAAYAAWRGTPVRNAAQDHPNGSLTASDAARLALFDKLQTEQVIAALPALFGLDGSLAYARIDLLRDEDGKPCLLELELTEPSLFFNYADGAAQRFVAALKNRLSL